MVNPDGRRHFWTRFYSPPCTGTDIGRGDVRAPHVLGAGGRQQDVHTKVVLPALIPWGRGPVVLSSEVSAPPIRRGGGGWVLYLRVSHARTYDSKTAVTGMRLRGRLSGLL